MTPKAKLVQAVLNAKKKQAPEGSAAEEKGESASVEKQESVAGKGDSKPSAGMSKSAKSSAVKQAQSGKDMGAKGKNFAKIAAKAGGGEKGNKIAGAVFWNKMKKRGA